MTVYDIIANISKILDFLSMSISKIPSVSVCFTTFFARLGSEVNVPFYTIFHFSQFFFHDYILWSEYYSILRDHIDGHTRNSRISGIFGTLSYLAWFFGDLKFVLVVNNITHQKCNVKGHSKNMCSGGSYTCWYCVNVTNYS